MWGLSRRRRKDSPGRHAPAPLWPVPLAAVPLAARPVPLRPAAFRPPPIAGESPQATPSPARARTLAEEVAELLASGQAWACADVAAQDHHLPSSQWGSDAGGTELPVFAPVVELGFRDGSSVRLDPEGAAGRDLQRAARALVVPAPPT